MAIEREELYRLYEVEGLTIKEVSLQTGYAVGTIFNYLKKYGIETRPPMTEATKAKISKSNKGRVSCRKGIKLSDEVKHKISESKRGKYTKPSGFGGHKKIRTDGYIAIYIPSHPRATDDGYVLEHILVMERAIGRHLAPDEVVHHKNHKRDDNRLENLGLMTFRDHASLHTKERWENEGIPHKTIKVRNVETGEIFESVKSAAQKYMVAPTNITRACRSKQRTVKTYHWEYVKEN